MDISLSHGPASRKSLSFSSFHAPKQANAVNATIRQRPQPTTGHDAQADSAEANGRRLTLRSSPVIVIFLFVDHRSSSLLSRMQILLPAHRIVVPASSSSRRWRDCRPPRLNGGESGGRGAQEQRRQQRRRRLPRLCGLEPRRPFRRGNRKRGEDHTRGDSDGHLFRPSSAADRPSRDGAVPERRRGRRGTAHR